MKFDIIIMEELKKIYPEAEIAVQDVRKTNISYKALTIRENGNPLSPAINLDDYEKRYEDGASIDMIVASIDSVYQEHKGDMSVVPEMTRENFLSHTTLKLINREKNADKMEDTPYIEWADLIAIPVYVNRTEGGMTSIVEHNSLLKNLGITPEEALEAGKQSLSPKVGNIRDVVMSFLGSDYTEQDLNDVIDLTDPNTLYVMSNSQKYFGASAVLDTKKLDEICEIMGDDLIILPSSIHEVLIISAEGHDPKELCQIVHDVNTSCVSPEEVLSENVYLYDRELHQVKTCAAEIGMDEREAYGV